MGRAGTSRSYRVRTRGGARRPQGPGSGVPHRLGLRPGGTGRDTGIQLAPPPTSRFHGGPPCSPNRLGFRPPLDTGQGNGRPGHRRPLPEGGTGTTRRPPGSHALRTRSRPLRRVPGGTTHGGLVRLRDLRTASTLLVTLPHPRGGRSRRVPRAELAHHHLPLRTAPPRARLLLPAGPPARTGLGATQTRGRDGRDRGSPHTGGPMVAFARGSLARLHRPRHCRSTVHVVHAACRHFYFAPDDVASPRLQHRTTTRR